MNQLSAIGRSFLAILAGFAAMVALIMITTVLLSRVAPGFVGENERPRLPYMLFNLAFSAIYASIGGWITARLTPLPRNPLPQTLMLAIVVLVLGAMSAIQLKGKQPIEYQIALTALTPVAVVIGGLLRMYQLGYRW